MNLKILETKNQKPSRNWENSGSVLSAHEISLDAPIKFESETK